MPPTYTPNTHHRNKRPDKTQWHKTISLQQEKEIWQFGHTQKWRRKNSVFSVYPDDTNNLRFLDDKKELNYARFTGDQQEDWHGWPANPKRQRLDLPTSEIFDIWVTKKYTNRCRVRKVRGLQECSI